MIHFFDLRFASAADSLQQEYQLRDYSASLKQLDQACKELGYRSVVHYRANHDSRMRNLVAVVDEALNEFVSLYLVIDSQSKDGRNPLDYRLTAYSNRIVDEAKRLARDENAIGHLPETQKKGVCCTIL